MAVLVGINEKHEYQHNATKKSKIEYIVQGEIQKFRDFKKKKKKLVFLCKHFIGRLRNSPLRTEYNVLHDQEDYRITFLGHPFIAK